MQLLRTAFAPPSRGLRASIALFAVRILIGLAFVFHGYPKMVHPTNWMTSMGSHAFAPGWLQAIVAGVEFFGGFALILGFATSLAAALILSDMFVALFFVVIPSGAPFVGQRSFELPALYLVMMLAFILLGPGDLAVDAWLTHGVTRATPDRLRRVA